MQKDEKEGREFRVLGRMMAEEMSKEAMEQASGGILKASRTMSPPYPPPEPPPDILP